MNWYNYVACFFAGAFLANVVPHFFHGISGDRFPTPFAHPPGRGLSSPTVNVVWAWINLVIGYVLFRAGRVSSDNYAALIVLRRDNPDFVGKLCRYPFENRQTRRLDAVVIGNQNAIQHDVAPKMRLVILYPAEPSEGA